MARLLTSLHDVSPLTIDRCREAVELLRESGVPASALTVLVGRALFATGDRSAALANLFEGAIDHSSNEPNRTALAAAIYLAQCDDPRAGQAARTAIALYQAMPQLGRSQMAVMQERAKLP